MKKQMLIVVLGMMLVLCSCGAQSVSSSQAQAAAAPAVWEPAGAVSQAAQPTAALAADGSAREKAGCELFVPPLKLCGDNAAMIGCQGYYEYLAGNTAGWDLNAFANMEL